MSHHTPARGGNPADDARGGLSRRALLLGGCAAALGACTTSEPASPTTTTTSRSKPSGNPTRTASSSPLTGASPPAQPPGLGDPGPDITAGSRSQTQVALTFHGAGDPALTTQILRIIRSAQAAITVFAVGEWLAANPTIGTDITQAGNDLGNHTWSHQVMTRLSQAEATREVQRGAAAVTAAIGSQGLLFRPSGTASSTPTIQAAAAAAGYGRCISYDVDPTDYTDPGADAVRQRTLTAVQPGSIVSLHLGHPGTVTALPGILQGLADRRLTPVTLTRLLTAATWRP